MTKQEYLQTVRKQIHYIFDRDTIETELSQHLEDSIYDLMEDGHSREEAEDLAVQQMGDPISTGKMLNQEHHPLLGYLCMATSAILIPLLILGIFYICLLYTSPSPRD